MLPDRVSNPGPLTYESGALPIALRGPAKRAIYPLMNDRRPVIYLATNHFVSKTVFRITNTQETTKRQVYPSDISRFPPLR